SAGTGAGAGGQPGPSAAGPRAGGAGAGAARAGVPGSAGTGAGAGAARTGSVPAAARAQRVFIKIAADREQPEVLAALKQLLAEHAGPLATVLFYEREQRTIALSDKVRVKP